MRASDLVRLPAQADEATGDTRVWLERAQTHLAPLLPTTKRSALTTRDMLSDDGEAKNVLAHFGREGKNPRSLLGNWRGLKHSVQAIGGGHGDEPAPSWNGFEDIWVPVGDLQLAGRIGYAERDGRVVDADCIVLLAGMFGDRNIFRMRDLAYALREHGLHVLMLELRAHGQTELRYPDIYYNFGVAETIDLLRVSEWLEDQEHIQRTGLIGFCWGANHGMLAAWYDGCRGDHLSVSPEFKRRLDPVGDRIHFTAGILAFSSVLRYEDLLQELETPRSFLIDPTIANVQGTNRERGERKQHAIINHSLTDLLQSEFDRSFLNYEGSVADARRFLRFLPFRGKPAGDKLESVRVPLLIVHGVNDPLNSPQNLADLMAQTDNPLVAALILPGGGHVGFAPYARAYYFSLILNFFDPQVGAAGRSD